MRPRNLFAPSVCCCLMLIVLALPWPRSIGADAPGLDREPSGSLHAAAFAGADASAPGGPLSAALRDRIESDPKGEIWAMVVSERPIEAGRLGANARLFRWPTGHHVALARLPGAELPTVARLPGVTSVRLAEIGAPATRQQWPDRSLILPRAADPETRQARLRAAPDWSDTAEAPSDPGDTAARLGPADPPIVDSAGAEPGTTTGWHDVLAGHAGKEAWELGYRGEGVRVAVLDYPVDFAHPDLQGTQAVFPDGHPYAGWPQVFDPVIGLRAIEEEEAGVPVEARASRRAGSGMIELYQTSAVTATEEAGVAIHTACLAPGVFGPSVGPFALAETDCGYRVPGTSMSGIVRYGHHPDSLLRARDDLGEGIDGQWPGVLLVDETTAGEYDTVYVDVDADRDFADEKPMTRDSPAGWRDVDGDGLADASAGLLYWISDGDLPFPTSWIWGLQDRTPAAGEVIGLLFADGDHGTLCASNVASRGVLGVPPDREVRFRDLPDGQPHAVNGGLAPDASLVSVGNVYASDSLFEVAWVYLAFGEEPGRDDDDVQVASNSYGFSDVDNDGWDSDSRLIDHLVRNFNPNLSFLVATGNGAPGYGTVTAPKPAVGMGIAASTQMGSTGSDMLGNAIDSITETGQITFGDIVSWSNRGPGADGSPGLQLAADGADASGGVPLNTVGDGAHANATWSGTSRSTPVAAGAMALVYEAYRERTGAWPTWQEARSILMAGARFSGYDTFTAGAGVLDAADSVRIAAGLRGVYAMPAEWTAGGYHGRTYPAFASLVHPGEVATTTIRLENPTDRAVRVRLSARTPRRIGSTDSALVTKPEQQSPSGDVPDYLVPIDRDAVPLETELLVARAVFPLAEFDADRDYSSDSRLSVAVLQHTDINGDGILWDDANGNGVVNHRQLESAFVRTVVGGIEQEIPAVEGFWITRPMAAEGVSGTLAWMGPACDGEEPVQEVADRIALIDRGGCPFGNKVANAQTAGAIGTVLFSDERPPVVMFAMPSGLTIPALMIDGAAGAALRDLLLQDAEVLAELGTRRTVGLDGSAPVVWSETEMQRYEYMRFNADQSDRNNFAVAVHHPLQRWADGMYVALWHSDPASAVGYAVTGAAGVAGPAADGSQSSVLAAGASITPTHVSLRYDYYAYRPWDAVEIPSEASIPAGGHVDIEVRLTVPEDAPPGALQGAIFVDHSRTVSTSAYLPAAVRAAPLANSDGNGGGMAARSAGPRASRTAAGQPARLTDLPIAPARSAEELDLAPGGYELPFLRTVIPVNANVAATYDWQGIVRLGGEEARDPDGPYDNGATRGTFTWDWREESGDWRFFFLDAAAVDTPVRWLLRTTWTDPAPVSSDIDTRMYGPRSDPFTAPGDEGDEMLDPDWYGPYTLEMVGRSPYLVMNGTVWPFETSSGQNEDWVSAQGSEGLHELLLHNVLYAGSGFDLPFRAEVGSVQLSTDELRLVGDVCGSLVLTPTLALSELQVTAYGPAEPTILEDVPALQDNPDDPAGATFRHRLELTADAGTFAVTLLGEADDDLDLYLLYDANGDGVLSFEDERAGESAGTSSEERIELPGVAPSGTYEVWVHGYLVEGADSVFDLRLDVISGNNLIVRDPPPDIEAGRAASLEVCADISGLAPSATEASGLLFAGPRAAPRLIGLPVSWQREP